MTRRTVPRRDVIAIAAFLIFVGGGCVKETVVGTRTVFEYESWVPAGALLGCIVAVVVGWLFRKRFERYAWGLVVAGVGVGVVVPPSLWRDRATIDADGFSLRTGIWGLTSVHQVRFEQVQAIRVVTKSSRVRGKRFDYYLQCQGQAVVLAEVPVNNHLARAWGRHIRKAAAARGIEVVSAPGFQAKSD